ncbi:MAG: sugar transferase [Candidatus Dormibacteraeota bacterium]|uniref:Sugar transferase n=1 Tax=Candidatus Aeolococcus gillhamiae TaxID=3127015 RepID=A0A934K0W1_9BACT|nr:sugar transferase [Candidatus Dormibacteraeota bacterium]
MLRLVFSAAEGLGLLAVLAAGHRLSPAWAGWAVAIVLGLSGVDRRAASRVSPRLADAVLPVAERVALATLVLVPLNPARATAGLVALGVTVVPVLLLARGLALLAVRAACRRGWLEDRVLIVGSGEVATRLARATVDHPGLGMRVIGLIDDEGSYPVDGVCRLGSFADIESVARRAGVTRILLAFSSLREAQMVRLLITCERLRAEIYAVPRFFEVGVEGTSPDELCGIPLTLLPRPLQRLSNRMLKRGCDILVSLAALTVLAPVLVLVAAAVRVSGPRPFVGKRPIFFRQVRVGMDGREFAMFKFRSMVPNDDGDRTWSVVGDPRVTRLGSFLRRTGLDEAPQLWNVLRGDMSLVGPRPERPLIANVFAASIPEYQSRHRVRVGITGWAQVNGLRGDTSIIDRARLDNYYVSTWSLTGDLVILIRTAMLLVKDTIPLRELRGRPRATSWVTEVGTVSPAEPAFEAALAPILERVLTRPIPTASAAQTTLVHPVTAVSHAVASMTPATQPAVAQTSLLHADPG